MYARISLATRLNKQVKQKIMLHKFARQELDAVYHIIMNKYHRKNKACYLVLFGYAVLFLLIAFLGLQKAYTDAMAFSLIVCASMLLVIWLWVKICHVEYEKWEFFKALEKGYPEYIGEYRK